MRTATELLTSGSSVNADELDFRVVSSDACLDLCEAQLLDPDGLHSSDEEQEDGE
ncbi:hypothetical protein T265_00856 [Opisthorchis viverrini]|uniref:Uncharacterized protein n=1 Tax=Opisthorchis viverrini TaxID=6198 RepID=A0A075A1F1_OPIVI|nr:hypothetical protein T265_00856 [Opisthorchis viverrini]KER33156.1 hypothetical protein T265_00856 [Opisthorchis viverrini]